MKTVLEWLTKGVVRYDVRGPILVEARRLEARIGWQVAEREEDGARQRLSNLDRVAGLWGRTRDLYWQEYILNKRSLGDVINAERDIHATRIEQITAQGDAAAAAMKALVAEGGLVALLERKSGKPPQ
jgi:adhesin transport system outer membrane protein